MAEGNGNGNGSGATTTEARVDEAVARSLEQTRRWLAQRRTTAEVLGAGSRLSTREWLVRASFALFAVVAMGVVAFSALGLLDATEAISAMLPVSTLTAVIVGIYLGSDRSS